MRVRVILNPRAGSGRAFDQIGTLGEALRRYDLPHDIVLTRERGHARELALAAADGGIDVLAVAGGDGTMNEVVQAYLGANGEPRKGPDLAVIPGGTGGDFRRSLGLSGGIEEAVARIRHGARRPIDLGVLQLTTEAGGDAWQAFLNVVSFGIGGRVDAIGAGFPKWLGGKATFFAKTLGAMATYKNVGVRVKIEGAVWYEGPVFNCAVANGRYFGGGMMIAPQADPADGRLEVVCLGDLSRREALALSSKIYRGAHLAARGVKVAHGVRVEAEPLHPWGTVLLDVDGEQPGKLPARAHIVKGALTFRV